MNPCNCEALKLIKQLERRTNELQGDLVNLSARLRLLDMNNAEDLQELFAMVQNIQEHFNRSEPDDECTIPTDSIPDSSPPSLGAFSFAPCLADSMGSSAAP